MGSLKVRSFKINDYRKVRTLWKECGLEMRPGDSLTEVQIKVRRDPDLFVVAELDGKIVGSVMGAWDGRRGWLYHVGVLPEHQRTGVATRLVREVERRMRAKGIIKVNAIIYKWNRRSLAFFRRSGYDVDRTTVHAGKFLRRASPPRRTS